MAKQSNQKLKLLYLLRIFLEHTDETSGMTIAQLSSELLKYNISAARKSLYDDIEALRLFGIDIRVKRDRCVRYYVARRELSFLELKYIIDALENFDALAFEPTNELVEKLIKIFGVRGRLYNEKREALTQGASRTVYDEVGKSIELLMRSIELRVKISCREFDWNPLKQRIVKNDGAVRVLTPIRLFYEDRYLLLADDGSSVATYDVDKLLDVKLTALSAEKEIDYRERFIRWQQTQDLEMLRLECKASFAGEAFSRFGLGVTVLSVKDDSFEISAKAKLNDSLFSWLFVNAKRVRIISPERARDIYREKLQLALDNSNQ